MTVLGQIVSGGFGELVARQKAGISLEIGELLISEAADKKVLLQVYNLQYGSQLSQQTRELVSGMKLEEENDLEILDPELRNYNLAFLKPLVSIDKKSAVLCKVLPNFFAQIRELQEKDISFLATPKNPISIGKLRSGSKALDFDVLIDGEKALTHHILIPAQTGKGKSNLAACMLWDALGRDYCGILVLDPHDEYYGRNKLGLKDHPGKKAVYYTINSPPAGAMTLKINVRSLKPSHFNGVISWSDPQREALYLYNRRYKSEWIERILLDDEPLEGINEGTLAVLKRRLQWLLSISLSDGQLYSDGVFDLTAGNTTISDICDDLEKGKVVIIDTSSLSGSVELLVGSMVCSEAFSRYRGHKRAGILHEKPVISVLLEEAPRVIGKEALERGPNIFSSIAREGRKFKIGLIAITQLPSLIPRDILANMNTKIVLGIEMAPERKAIIDSAAQDLSQDERAIAALDKGEAIITSHFTKFAIPVKIPLFEEVVKKAEKSKVKLAFPGLKG
ncbi:ATP-binding protein [Candidatus Woesearchaeota archaeon]|nr:ATP-binding protein [Candidatus Woesearchaeota archaeon]